MDGVLFIILVLVGVASRSYMKLNFLSYLIDIFRVFEEDTDFFLYIISTKAMLNAVRTNP